MELGSRLPSAVRKRLQEDVDGVEVVAVEVDPGGPPYILHATILDDAGILVVDGFGDVITVAVKRLTRKIQHRAA